MAMSKQASKDWREVFLAALRKSPNVSAAARKAGYTRQWVYALRQQDEEFAAAWDDALAEAMDTAEGEIYRRAVRGVIKRVYYEGDKKIVVREYSDTLLIFLAKSHRPEVYRETVRSEVTGKDGGPIKHEDIGEAGERIASKLASLAARINAQRDSGGPGTD